MSLFEQIKKDLIETIRNADKKKTSAYDTQATVTRVDGGTAWVHIPGGVDETPIKMTVNASAGDTVQVRVGGGKAWIVGNATAPPTDDSYARSVATEINTKLSKADERLYETESGVDELNTLVRESADGIEVGKVDSSGAYVTGFTRINPTTNAYEVYDESGNLIASFGETVALGLASGNRMLIQSDAVAITDTNGTLMVFGVSDSTASIDLSGSNVVLGCAGLELFGNADFTVPNGLVYVESPVSTTLSQSYISTARAFSTGTHKRLVLDGAAASLTAGTTYTLGTLAADFRPVYAVDKFVVMAASTSASYMAHVTISTGGVVKFIPYQARSSGATIHVDFMYI